MKEGNRWHAVRIAHSCWRFVKWGVLLGVLCAVLAGTYLLNHADEQIRSRVEAILARHYQGLTVSVRSARLLERQGFEIRGLSISGQSDRAVRTELVYCDEIHVRCQPTLEGLMARDLNVRQVTVRRVTVRASRHRDGQWNVLRLFPLPRFGKASPPVSVENATLEIVDSLEGPSRLLTLRNINLRLVPRSVGPQTADARGQANSSAASRQIRVDGSLTGDHLRRVDLEGVVNPYSGEWSLGGQVIALAIGPELCRSLPADVGHRLEGLGSLQAQGTIGFQVAGRLGSSAPVRYRLAGQISDGRIADPRLTYPVTDLAAQVAVDNDGLKIDAATARYGPAALQLSCWLSGHQPTSPALVLGSVQRLRVDRKLVDILPEGLGRLRAQWHKLQPTGSMNADFRIRFDGQRWMAEQVELTCLDVSLCYDRFPYPLQQGTGTISLKNDLLEITGFQALAGETPVHVGGRIWHPGPDWSGELTLESAGLVPLDRQLIEANPPAVQRIIRDFNPRGSVSVFARFRREPGPQSPVLQQWVIRLQDCWVRHARFPYPLGQISGLLHMQDGFWIFSQLTGRNDSAEVRCEGTWDPQQAGGLLTLNFEARDVPLEDELRDALPPGTKELWNGVRPRGTLDHLEAALTYSKADQQTRVALTLRQPQQANAGPADGRGISIDPRWFPYRIDHLTGTVTIRDGTVTLSQMQGHHDTVPIHADGRAQIAPQGDWHVRLERLLVDRMSVDRQLIQALPLGLRRCLTRLNLTGPISLDGSLELSRKAAPAAPLAVGWNMLVQVADASLNCGIALDHITGAVRLNGASDGQTVRSHGSLDIDSLMYRGLHLTRVQGPVWFDQTSLLWGTWVPGSAEQPQARVQGRLFGGSVEGDGCVWFDQHGSFELQVKMMDAGLAELVRDMSQRPTRVQGKCYGVLRLAGTGEGKHTLRGGGQIALRDADIYELPLVVALLSILLRAKAPERTAFTSSDIRFRVQGEDIYLDQMDLRGDAITLKGVGELSLRGDIRLDFYSLIGRERDYLPGLLQIVGEASRRFMRIHVTGSFDEPQTTQEVLPFVNETLQQLFPEAAAPVLGRAAGAETK